MTFQPSGKVEFQQDHENLCRMLPGVTDELVDAVGVGPSASMMRARSLSLAGGVAKKSGGSSRVCRVRSAEAPCSGARSSRMSRCLGDQDRAILEQAVCAAGARVER